MGVAVFQKTDYVHMAWLRRIAFVKIATELGPDHVITKMMGPLASGKIDGTSFSFSLQDAVREVAFLDGYYSCLSRWASDNHTGAQVVMNKTYPHKFEKAPT